jgi:hypothetical protein
METILATEQPAEVVVRHLAAGSAEHTLCGLDRAELSTVHPSKARKTDCPTCREAWRTLQAQKPPKHEPQPMPVMTPEAIEIISADGELKAEPSAMEKAEEKAAKLYAMASKLAPELVDKEIIVRDPADGELKPKSNLISFKEYSVGTTKPGPGEPNPPDEVTPTEDSPEVTEEAQDVQETPMPEVKLMTVDEIDAEVTRLRGLGLSHIKIETAMNWSKQHGNRSWRICQRLGIK